MKKVSGIDYFEGAATVLPLRAAVDGAVSCPCCGFLTLGEAGGYEICPVCYWEDDLVQEHDPNLSVGADAVSLNVARKNFQEFGASELGFKKYVRHPLPKEMMSHTENN